MSRGKRHRRLEDWSEAALMRGEGYGCCQLQVYFSHFSFLHVLCCQICYRSLDTNFEAALPGARGGQNDCRGGGGRGEKETRMDLLQKEQLRVVGRSKYAPKKPRELKVWSEIECGNRNTG